MFNKSIYVSAGVILSVFWMLIAYGCILKADGREQIAGFHIEEAADGSSLSVFRDGSKQLVLTQNARDTMRPYLHPIMAPDGTGSLTQYSPGHHRHQTGLYWGFTRVNGTGAPDDTLKKWFYNRNKPKRIQDQIGRDFFHFNGKSHWKKVESKVLVLEGEKVEWQTIYQMLDADSAPILQETMHWTLSEGKGKYIIDLIWKGKAIEDITINRFSYGGMFLRMPWSQGIEGAAVNSYGEKNQQAEGKNARWVDVGMQIDGAEKWGHIAILDHLHNTGHPTPWRVDGQLGIGPCRAITGDWQIKESEEEVMQFRIVAYSGVLDKSVVESIWKSYVN